jgi:ketosteroid isomerase-like protein
VSDQSEAERANVAALRAIYDHWGRGDWQPRFALYAEDFEWGWSEEFPDRHGVERDPNDRSPRLVAWLSEWDDWRCEVEDLVASGQFVVALTRYTGRGKESGAGVDAPGAHLWTMRDGRAVRLEVFSSRERALRAAGLNTEDGSP